MLERDHEMNYVQLHYNDIHRLIFHDPVLCCVFQIFYYPIRDVFVPVFLNCWLAKVALENMLVSTDTSSCLILVLVHFSIISYKNTILKYQYPVIDTDSDHTMGNLTQ